MTPPRLAGAAAALATAGSLVFTGIAAANAGQKTFAQTYPRASVLCAHVSAGGGPKRLRRAAPLVLADCSTLQNGFTAAQAAVLTGDASIAAAQAALRTTTRATCVGSGTHSTTCRRARHKRDRAMDRLAAQRVALAHAYFRTVEADRLVFWSAIRSLPGGRALPEDARIPEQSP
jgi:hypothetical protein